MLNYQSIEMLRKLNLNSFASEFEEQEKIGGFQEMSFADRLTFLVQTEILERENRNIKKKLSNAKLKHNASLENVKTSLERGLDK